MARSGEVATDAALERLIARLVAFYHPHSIYLFGSRASGKAHADSDYDLYVVVPDDTPPERLNLTSAYKAVRSLGLAVDVIPCRRSLFDKRKGAIGTMAHTVLTEGKRVYGA
jgi:uncharacterized protein